MKKIAKLGLALGLVLAGNFSALAQQVIPSGGGGGGGGTPGGTSGQIQYNNGGSFGGFTVSGDCLISTGTGAITCSSTNGTAFGTAATANTGTSGATLGLLNGNLTFGGSDTFSSTIAGSISGNAATVTTNANMTGDVTSVGNATTVAHIAGVPVGTPSGTGNVAFTTSPVFTTPNIGVATGSVSGNAGSAYGLSGQFPVRATAYGAAVNGVLRTDGTTTNGSPNICSAGYNFISGDVGKVIAAYGAGNAGGTVSLVGTIASISSNCAVIGTNASKTISGTASIAWGSNDTTPITNAVAAAAALPYGGKVILGDGISITTAPIFVGSEVKIGGDGQGTSVIIAMSSSDWPNNGVFYNHTATYAAPSLDNQFSYFEINGLFMNDATYVVNAKGIDFPYTSRSSGDHLFIHDTPATCFATDYGYPTSLTNSVIGGCGRLTGSNSGGNGFGEGTNGAYVPESFTVANNYFYNVHNDAILFEGQASGNCTSCFAVATGNIIYENVTGGTRSAGIVDAGNQGTVIVGNKIYGGASISAQDCIDVNAGTFSGPVPGTAGLIEGNYCSNTSNGIVLDFTGLTAAAQSRYRIIGNTVLAPVGDGIRVTPSATYATSIVDIENNMVTQSGAAGIDVQAGAGGISYVNISGNTLANNGATTPTDALKTGISINVPISHLNINNNLAFDNLSNKQLYCFVNNDVALTNVTISNNPWNGCFTQGIKTETGGTYTGTITNNLGYNPVGTTSPSPGASPYTFTNGTSPATLYISGGTISSVTKNSTSLPGLLTGGSIPLAPNDTVVITYSVAPTLVLDTN